MAITSLGLLLLAQRYRGDLTPQINRMAALLSMLPIDEDAGKNCAWGFKGSGKTARAFLEGAEAEEATQDAQWPATLSWGLYDFTMGITNLAASAAKSSGGDPDRNNDVWADQIQEGVEVLSSTLNQDLYNGDGSGTSGEPTIVGLGEIYGSITNSYAGLDRSSGTYASLRPFYVDPGSPTAFTLKMFRDDLAKIYVNSGARPDIAVAQPLLFNMIGQRFDNIRRIEQYATIQTAGKGPIKLDGSARVIEVDGCLVVEDKDAVYTGETSTGGFGSLTYINTKFLRLKVLPPADVFNDEVKKRYQLNDGYNNLLLNVKYEKLAKTGSSEKARGEIQLQLQCKRPNSGGMRKNILIA
jgi:hypothetical protein